MKCVRWYDKNPSLKKVFNFIESIDYETQSVLAKDILQILMSDLKLNLDYKLNKLAKVPCHENKRWYDKNIDLSSSFEIIRELNDGQKKYVADKIVESAVLMYFTNGENN